MGRSMSGDRVYWHDGERTARVPIDCVHAIVSQARDTERVQPATCVAVFTALALHANGSGEGARPKVETIAELLDLSEGQVRRVISSVLVKAGVVSKSPWVVDGRKCGTTYRLTRPQAHSPTAHQGALPIAHQGADEPRTGARLGEQTSEQTKEQTEGEDPIRARARQIVDRVWERSDPKPATPYIGCVKIAEKLLKAGHDPQHIGRAMLEAPTISTGAVEFAINRRTKQAPTRREPIDTNREGPEGRIDL